ncbi:two-component system sensor histidine kinase BaeS [Tahibacter aquaticus]|uniref:histidine kinase n=1 Tax=Tahibacter aquaticus TaxID=520092 RepID=A0A4R6YSB2_9GAMM|nr:ATP-binding protein [Tahibacter aquaticus]TDR41131.1 two-component system sensor histidine kinase BaeS [Tahibacter aquaticus]
MRLSIGHRLFVALLAAILLIAAIGLELVRWTLFDNFSARRNDADAVFLGALADGLAERYRQSGNWSFLPPAPRDAAVWLGEQIQHGKRPSPRATIPTNLAERVGVLDAHEQLLAGTIARRWVIAFASVDTIRRPVEVDGRTVGYVVLAQSRNPDDALAVAFLLQQQDRLLLALGLGVLVSALVAALLAAHFRRPIRRLRDASRRLEEGQFDTRLALRRGDELGELAQAFDRLAARLADAEALRRRWVADTSHELRTPLSVLRAQLESLQDGIRRATPDNIASMLRQVGALGLLVDDLSALARGDVERRDGEPVATDAWPLVDQVFTDFADKFRRAGLHASLGAAPAQSTVRCDAEPLRRVLSNLLENCVRYTDPGGAVDVQWVVAGKELHIVVDDTAPGVAQAALARLGERFFRPDPSRNRQTGGSGLGLALCRQIVEAHGGRLEFSASPLGGLRARVVLGLVAP